MTKKTLFCLIAGILIFTVNLFAQEFAVLLNGSSQYIDCGNDSYYNLTNNLTVEAWIYPTDFKASSTRNTIASKVYWTASNTYGWSFRYGSSSGTLEFNMSTGGNNWQNCTVTGALTLNTWQHVAATYNGSAIKIYVNGLEVGSTNATASIPTTTKKLCIGAIDLSTDMRYMTGKIDEVRIWKVARTASEIANNLYNSVSDANLLAYFQMNAGSGTVAVNSANPSYNGTLIGSPSWSTDIPFYACTVTTQAVSSIGNIYATGNGAITNLGSPNPYQHGHVWATTEMPTTADNKTELGVASSTGTFESSLSGLSSNTLYYTRAYATNAIGTSFGDQLSFRTLPSASAYTSPQDDAVSEANPPTLIWNAPLGGCLGYKVYLGTDNPPTNILNGISVVETSYTPALLQFNTQYYWKAVAYNATGNALDSQMWSFVTTDTYVNTDVAPVAVPGALPGTTINPTIQIPSITGEFVPVITSGWNPEGTPYTNAGLYLNISGANLGGRLIIINPGLGYIPTGLAYRILPLEDWNYQPAKIDWREDYVYFTVMGSKADGDVDILFPDSEVSTLPVTLSSFTAQYMAVSGSVMLNWIVQSETNHMGYNILRSENGYLYNAQRINQHIISSGNATGSMISYTYKDSEVYSNTQYLYWLESISLNNITEYYGPIIINTISQDEDTPDIPIRTTLHGAYPNPFNPRSTVVFSIEKPGKVNIDIFNARGQKVRSFEGNYAVSGRYSFIWDGKDDMGRALGSGIYHYRMRSDNYKAMRKLMLVK